jgi:hypothetical protein
LVGSSLVTNGSLNWPVVAAVSAGAVGLSVVLFELWRHSRT